jgi:hypothetical protein
MLAGILTYFVTTFKNHATAHLGGQEDGVSKALGGQGPAASAAFATVEK